MLLRQVYFFDLFLGWNRCGRTARVDVKLLGNMAGRHMRGVATISTMSTN